MLRKLVLWGMFAAVVGAGVFGYLTYAVVGMYDQETVKITHLYFVTKPERGIGFFYNHINKGVVEKELRRLKVGNRAIPWHLDYEWIKGNTLYEYIMDNRAK